MPKLLKKIFVSFLTALCLFASSFSTLRAQDIGPWYDQNFNQWYIKVYDDSSPTEIFGERYTAAQVQWVVYGLFSYLINQFISREAYICIINHQDISTITDECATVIKNWLNAIPLEQSSLTDDNKSLAEKIFEEERPISAITYFRNIGKNLNLIPEAQAQATGFGFTALMPVLPLWQSVRNITYALLVFVILIMAFMIMFRVKISPQVVITVQSAIPKITIALVLITFSYAIAGLLIDLMYVLIGLGSLMLKNASSYFDNYTVAQVFDYLTKGPNSPLGHLGIFGHLLNYWMYFFLSLVTAAFVANSPFTMLGLFFFAIVATIVLIVVLLFIGLKITWTLFRAAASILISTIIAPLQILFGVITPSMGFGMWLKNYIANLITFPLVGILLFLAQLFLIIALQYTGLSEIFGVEFELKNIDLQAYSETSWPPLLQSGRGFPSLVFIGTSFAIISVIPKTVDIIKSIIKGQEFAYGAAIGAPVKAAIGVVGYPIAQTYGTVREGITRAVVEKISRHPSIRRMVGLQPIEQE